MSELDGFIKVLKARRVESLKNAREKNNLPLFTGEAIAYRESIDLAKEMLLNEQPTLNENQQIVLDYLKDKCNVYSFISHKPFEAILRLSMLDPEKTELRVINTIDELTYEQQAQVLQAFASLVLEQEELND